MGSLAEQIAGEWDPLDRQHEAMSLAGKQVIVRTLRDGRVQLERGGVQLRWKEPGGRKPAPSFTL